MSMALELISARMVAEAEGAEQPAAAVAAAPLAVRWVAPHRARRPALPPAAAGPVFPLRPPDPITRT
jgi:hypothetical protein